MNWKYFLFPCCSLWRNETHWVTTFNAYLDPISISATLVSSIMNDVVWNQNFYPNHWHSRNLWRNSAACIDYIIRNAFSNLFLISFFPLGLVDYLRRRLIFIWHMFYKKNKLCINFILHDWKLWRIFHLGYPWLATYYYAKGVKRLSEIFILRNKRNSKSSDDCIGVKSI